MSDGRVHLYRFSWETPLYSDIGKRCVPAWETRLAVWVEYPRDTPRAQIRHYDLVRPLNYEAEMQVDMDLDLAAEWRTAVETYLNALQTARQDYHRTVSRGWARGNGRARYRGWAVFRGLAVYQRWAERRYVEAASAAEDAYEPIRAAASRALDDVYIPWKLRREAEWKARRIAQEKEILAEIHRGTSRKALRRASKDRYRAGGTGTAGSGGFGNGGGYGSGGF